MNFKSLLRLAVLVLTVLLAANKSPADDGGNATFFTVLSASSLQANQTAVLAIVVDIAPGLHTQSHEPLNADFIKFEVTPTASDSVKFLDPIYPKGMVQNFPALGNQSIYTDRVVIYLPIRVNADVHTGKITLGGTMTWQACDDKVCYAPENNTFSLPTEIVPVGTAYTMGHTRLFAGFDQSVFAVGAAPAAAAVVASKPDGASADFSAGILSSDHRMFRWRFSLL